MYYVYNGGKMSLWKETLNSPPINLSSLLELWYFVYLDNRTQI